MGVQVPCCFYSEMPQKGALWKTAAAFGRGIPKIGRTEGMSRRRGPSSRRPCTHHDLDSAQVCGVVRGGIHQGQERDPSGSNLWRTKAKLRRAKLLGARIFRINSGSG